LFVCPIIVRIRKGWLILTVQLEQSLMIDEVFPETKRTPRARSIMIPTGDNLEHRITRWIKDHKGLVYSSSLLSFPVVS